MSLDIGNTPCPEIVQKSHVREEVGDSFSSRIIEKLGRYVGETFLTIITL